MLSVVYRKTPDLIILKISIPDEYHLCSGGNCKGNSTL